MKKGKYFMDIFSLYYRQLDSLAKRLQDNYNEGIPFEQEEEDRLAICGLLDLFNDLKGV